MKNFIRFYSENPYLIKDDRLNLLPAGEYFEKEFEKIITKQILPMYKVAYLQQLLTCQKTTEKKSVAARLILINPKFRNFSFDEKDANIFKQFIIDIALTSLAAFATCLDHCENLVDDIISNFSENPHSKALFLSALFLLQHNKERSSEKDSPATLKKMVLKDSQVPEWLRYQWIARGPMTTKLLSEITTRESSRIQADHKIQKAKSEMERVVLYRHN